jgi:hypothetical protein
VYHNKVKIKGLLLFLFVDVMMVYLKGCKDSTRKLLDLLNTFSKVEYKSSTQKPVAFLYTMNTLGKKSGKQYHSK